MTEQRISDRRVVVTYRDGDEKLSYIGMWVDDVQIAAAVRQPPLAPETRDWHLWSSGLVYPPGSPPSPGEARPLLVANEHDARAWLDLIADLAEHGPAALARRKKRSA